MKKILFFVAIFSTLLNADYLLSSENICIQDFYTQNGSFYYQDSSDSVWYSTTDTSQYENIFDGFTYEDSKCFKNTELMFLGIESHEYNFLIALVALLCGFITLFFMIYISIEVARK